MSHIFFHLAAHLLTHALSQPRQPRRARKQDIFAIALQLSRR